MSQELWKSYFNTGLESAKAGMVETSIDYFEWSAKLKPDNQEILYNLGVSYMTIGKMKDAIKAFTSELLIIVPILALFMCERLVPANVMLDHTRCKTIL